jgi:hypothetical protein
MTRRLVAPAAAAVTALFFSLAPGRADAQVLGIPVALDARAEIAFPLGTFGDMAGTGAGGSISLAVPIVPAFGAYGSFTHIRFGGGWTGDGNADAATSGFTVGITTTLPGTMNVDPWVGGGLIFHNLEVRGTRQGVSQDMGFEVGAGVAVPLAGQLRLTPAVHYRQFGATVPALAGVAARDMTVQYLSLGIGLNLWF